MTRSAHRGRAHQVDLPPMTAVLALAASAFWGASDFMGGAVSRRVGIYLQNFKKMIEDEAARADGR